MRKCFTMAEGQYSSMPYDNTSRFFLNMALTAQYKNGEAKISIEAISQYFTNSNCISLLFKYFLTAVGKTVQGTYLITIFLLAWQDHIKSIDKVTFIFIWDSFSFMQCIL